MSKSETLVCLGAVIHQIASTKIANQMMADNWGTHTNEAGHRLTEHEYAVKLHGEGFSALGEFGVGMKAFLRDMYLEMNKSILEELERKKKKLEEELVS